MLGEHQLFSRSGKVARFDYGDVNPEIFNLHIVHLSVTVIVIQAHCWANQFTYTGQQREGPSPSS
ncbi:hypothetical protein ERD80_00160 [Pantoea sp. R102]|nr:hypothetical protein ERD80_00160 [Pantoea sp. R102]